MPGLSVKFYAGSKAQYDALAQKDSGGLYFITDKKTLYKGDKVISRYAISGNAVDANGLESIRITDLHTGAYYDIPLLAGVSGMLENNMVLHYSSEIITSNADLVAAINAVQNVPGTGEFPAGRVFRVESEGHSLELNPGQFGKPDMLFANDHDLVITLYDHGREDANFRTNHEMFAVLPTDLWNLVTGNGQLDNGKVILGQGGNSIQAMNFGNPGQILAMNSGGNGVQWLTPETVENVIYWEDIQQS